MQLAVNIHSEGKVAIYHYDFATVIVAYIGIMAFTILASMLAVSQIAQRMSRSVEARIKQQRAAE